MAKTPPRSMLSCGTATTFVLSNEGDLWVTGLNHQLQLGLSNACQRNRIQPLSWEYFELVHSTNNKIPAFRAVYTCGSTTFATTVENSLFSWGNNNHGQLGQGDANDVCLPARVCFLYSDVSKDMCLLPKIWQVSCGNNHTLILSVDGRILSCGENTCGQLGRGDMDFTTTCNRFVVVYPLHGQHTAASKNVRSIASGAYVCAMILEDESLWLWGNHVYGQVPGAPRPGGGFLPRKIPFKIEDIADDYDNEDPDHERRPFLVESISISIEHCACITTDKRVWTWGMNSFGKLGNGTKNGNSCRPASVMSASQLQSMSMPVEICCGGHHTLIRTSIGSLWAAGAHKLGIGIDGGHESSLCRFQRVALPRCAYVDGGGNMQVLAMAAGKTHSAIITTGGHVMTCGKMKASIPVTPRPLEEGEVAAHSAFGGLGYFQGLAQQGHVSTFQKVYKLQGKVSFFADFSACTLAKVHIMLLGAHFDKTGSVASTTPSTDRMFMNLVPDDVLDVIIRQIIVV